MKVRARLVIRLLGELQTHLESIIETSLAPGETIPRDAVMRRDVAKARKDWKAAEACIAHISASKSL